MIFALNSLISLIVLAVYFNTKTTNAQAGNPFQPRIYGDRIEQCPCIISRGSNKCTAYDSRYQASSIAEAIISFNDLSLNPRLSSRSSFSDFACRSYECQQCAGALITKFRKIGLLGETEPVGLNVPAIPEYASQCEQLRFVKLPRKFAEPAVVPPYMREMIRQGQIHFKRRNRGSGRGRNGNSNNQRRSQQSRARPPSTGNFNENGAGESSLPLPPPLGSGPTGRLQPDQGGLTPRIPIQHLPNRHHGNHGRGRHPQNPNRRFNPRHQRPQGNQGRPRTQPESGSNGEFSNGNVQIGGGGGWSQQPFSGSGRENGDQNGQTGAQFPNTNGGGQFPSGNWNMPSENANNGENGQFQNGRQFPGGWNSNFPGGIGGDGRLPNAAQQFVGGIMKQVGENIDKGGGNVQSRHSHEHSGGELNRGEQEGQNQFGGGWSNGQRGFDGTGGGLTGGPQGGQRSFPGGHLGGGAQGGQTEFDSGFGVGQQSPIGVGGDQHGDLGGMSAGFGGIGGIGFGAKARERRAIQHNSNGFIGTRSTVVCADKGSVDPLDHESSKLGLCSVCWVIRTLPENYAPRYINELICNGNSRECLTGWGKCEQKTRPMIFNRYDRMKNGTLIVAQVQIQAGMCCDCQVLAGSSIFTMVVGKV